MILLPLAEMTPDLHTLDWSRSCLERRDLARSSEARAAVPNTCPSPAGRRTAGLRRVICRDRAVDSSGPDSGCSEPTAAGSSLRILRAA